MPARTITSANSILMLAVSDLFDTPQQLQGFATDDIFDTDSVAPAETMMGVDGRLSGGWVPVPISMNISLQADSDSNFLFETWYQQQQAQGEVFIANGSVLLPATGRKYTMTRGFLTGNLVTPPAKKVLQPRRYTIIWESISAANI